MTDPARITAYEDALRGIALAAVTARQAGTRDALATMLADVEHHLTSLVVLGYVPPDTGRAVTSSQQPHRAIE